MLVIPFQRVQNTKQVNAGGHHNKHVENLMRAAPYIKVSRMKLLREPRAVDEGANKNQSTLGIVVGKAGLLVELLKQEQSRGVDDGNECREAGQDEDGKAEQAVLTALVGGMVHDVYR